MTRAAIHACSSPSFPQVSGLLPVYFRFRLTTGNTYYYGVCMRKRIGNGAAIKALRTAAGLSQSAFSPLVDVTQGYMSQIESGDPTASEQLLPLVYDELRRLAAQRLIQEKPGQTLQATALVHEAYLRLIDGSEPQHWNSRGHFFGAAAEAMRRILVDQARRKASLKGGGGEFVKIPA